jgi:hypothetical protein
VFGNELGVERDDSRFADVLAKLGELIGVGDQRNGHSSALIAAKRRSSRRPNPKNASWAA